MNIYRHNRWRLNKSACVSVYWLSIDMDHAVKKTHFSSSSFLFPNHPSCCPPTLGVLAGDAGHRTPFNAFLVGVSPTDHRCLSAPVRLGRSVFVATIPFSCSNHPTHRWTIARVRTHALSGPTRGARALRMVSTHSLAFTFNVERLFLSYCQSPSSGLSLHRSLRRRCATLLVQQCHVQPYGRVLYMSEPHLH